MLHSDARITESVFSLCKVNKITLLAANPYAHFIGCRCKTRQCLGQVKITLLGCTWMCGLVNCGLMVRRQSIHLRSQLVLDGVLVSQLDLASTGKLDLIPVVPVVLVVPIELALPVPVWVSGMCNLLRYSRDRYQYREASCTVAARYRLLRVTACGVLPCNELEYLV